jgi:hypothetical protein
LVESRQRLEQSLQITRNIGHRLENARCLTYLGTVANCLADYSAAQEYLREALQISREIGFTFGIPWSLGGLGTAVLGQNRPHEAAHYYYDALEIAMFSRDIPVALDIIVSLAALNMQLSAASADEARNLPLVGAALQFVLAHPAVWRVIAVQAERLLVDWRQRPAWPCPHGLTKLSNCSVPTLIDAKIGTRKRRTVLMSENPVMPHPMMGALHGGIMPKRKPKDPERSPDMPHDWIARHLQRLEGLLDRDPVEIPRLGIPPRAADEQRPIPFPG